MSMEDCTLYYQNVRGLRTTADDFYSNVATANYPILCLTETWLDDSCASAQYFTPGYTVFRRDRNYALTNQKRGGGVLILVDR